MKKRVTALLACLALCGSLLAAGAPVFAAPEDTADSGMVLHKTAQANLDGSYTIQLEAYATGEKLITEVTKDVPTDIVLVLDQSGSMARNMGTVSFKAYEDSKFLGHTTYHTRNQDYYACRHNGGTGNLYYRLADGSYVSVSVELAEQAEYTAIASGSTNYDYYQNRANLYALIDGQYQKVTVEYEYDSSQRAYVYTYTFAGGVEITSNGWNSTPDFGSYGPLYLISVDETQNAYTYKYTDAGGTVQTILTSTGAAVQPQVTFYEKVVDSSGGAVRLNALITAVTNFVNSVSQKAAGADGDRTTAADNVDHRIAIVGFSSDNYSNTELLTGSTLTTGTENYGTSPVDNDQGTYYYPTGYAKNGPDYYSGITGAQYKAALLDMSTQAGINGAKAGIEAITAHGGTQVQAGMYMANQIFAQNPIPEGEQRNRVVIVFTDGAPGDTQFDKTVATTAIRYADTAKTTYGATVYTVGIFAGADATSAGTEPAGNLNSSSSAVPAASNWFMQKLSSNNGVVQTPSYYLSASDADTLNSIFQQIADQIESGGATTTLDENTVIRDLVAPAFALPEGASAGDITVESYACTGVDSAGAYTWAKNETALGAQAAVSGSEVSVTGFDFAENYVGTVTAGSATAYRGNKLVITFTVRPKTGFLGGNNVYTNASAGVYENASADQPVLTFERPQVNVRIGDVSATAPDRNVYLLSGLTAEQLRAGATASVGGVELDLAPTARNYGLESWQTEYVEITVTITDENGVEIADLKALTDDQSYTAAVTVSPKTDGSGASGTPAAAKKDTDPGAVQVFKPALTFADSQVYYGDAAPTEYDANLVSTQWKHGTGAQEQTAGAAGVTVEGTAPALELSCTPAAGTVADGRIATKNDIGVAVAVRFAAAEGETGADVTAYTAFAHQDCAGKSCALPQNAQFLLHVNTCTLTVTKTGGEAGEPYVFTVYKDGAAYTQLTITGSASTVLYELPVGTYTIAEDAGWSWRDTAVYSYSSTGEAVLSARTPSGSAQCANTRKTDMWINGYSAVVPNVCGAAR